MDQKRWFTLPALLIVLGTVVTGCSSSEDKTAQGSFAVNLHASRLATTARALGAGGSYDETSRLLTVEVTLSGLEARRSDGAWVPVEGGFQNPIDLLALADSGGAVSLPSNLLPEGHYTALQVRISKADLTLLDGTHVKFTPPGRGWSVNIPVDFVVTGPLTIVDLNVRLDLSCTLVNGEFEFEPEIEVEGVEHD